MEFELTEVKKKDIGQGSPLSSDRFTLTEVPTGLAGLGTQARGLLQPPESPYEATEAATQEQRIRAGAIKDTARGMFFGKGLPAGLGALQKPTEKVMDTVGKYAMTPKEERKLQAKYPNLMALGYGVASWAPGGHLLFSPEEREAFKEMPVEAQRVAILEGTAGWVIAPAAFKAIGFVGKKVLQKTAPRFVEWLAKNAHTPLSKLGPGLSDALKADLHRAAPTRARMIFARERRLTELTVDDLIRAEGGDLAMAARKYPKVFRAMREQRAKGEAPTKRPVAPEEPIVPQAPGLRKAVPPGQEFEIVGDRPRGFDLTRTPTDYYGDGPGLGRTPYDVEAAQREILGRKFKLEPKARAILRKGKPPYTTPVAPREADVTYRLKQKGKAPVFFKLGDAEPWTAPPRKPPPGDEGFRLPKPPPKPKPAKMPRMRGGQQVLDETTAHKAKHLTDWIIAKGGISDKTLPGETAMFGPKETGVIGLVNKRGGQPFDELTAMARAEGWIPEDMGQTQFLEIVSMDIRARKAGTHRVTRMQDLGEQVAKRVEAEELDFADNEMIKYLRKHPEQTKKIEGLTDEHKTLLKEFEGKGIEREGLSKAEERAKREGASELANEENIPPDQLQRVLNDWDEVAKPEWTLPREAEKPPAKLPSEKEKASAIVVKKTGAKTPKGILSYYQKKYPELKGLKIRGLEATKESGPLVDAGVSRIILDDGRLNAKKSGIHLTADASPITVRHEIEHFLDVIHGRKQAPQTMGRFEHAKFTSEYIAKAEVEPFKLTPFEPKKPRAAKPTEAELERAALEKQGQLAMGKPLEGEVRKFKGKAVFGQEPKLGGGMGAKQQREMFGPKGKVVEQAPDLVEQMKRAKVKEPTPSFIKGERGAVTVEGLKKEPLSKYQSENIVWEAHKLDFSTEGIKNALAKVYTTFKMREYPAIRLAKKADKQSAEIVENQIRRLRGKGGIVEEMLTGKGPFRVVNYGTEKEAIQYVKNPKSLKTILSQLKSRQEYIDYETLRVAERDAALAIHRPDIKGTDLKASRAEIIRLENKYSAEDMARLRKISDEHRVFERQTVLRPLVEIGWMSQKSYDAIVARPESEYYASFAREMDVVERYTLGGKDPVKRIRGSEKKKIPSVEATIANVYKAAKLVETIRLNKEIVKLRDLSPELEELIIEVKPQYISKDVPKRPGPRGGTKVSVRSPIQPKQTIVVPVDGVKHFWRVPPDVHKALDYYSAKEMSTVIKLMAIPTKWLRAGATLSAEFIARNPVRDQFTAYVYSNYGYKPPIDFPKGIFHILKKTDMYHQFKASGAEQAYFVSVDRQSLKVNTRQLVGWKVATAKDVVDVANPLRALQAISMWMEKGTRVGAYARARRRGATPSQAMAEARELTLDFMRLGTERALNQVIAFWNANIEGTDRMARSFKGHPYRTSWRVLLGITVPSITLWALYHDDERIKALPDWRKNFCWNIPIPSGPIISIPKPFELGIIFGSLPERILDYIVKDDPEAIRSIAKAIKDGAAPGLIPTAGLPAIENTANYSFFMDRPLEGEALQNLPSGMRAHEYTSELAKRVGKTTDLSPIKIDNWIRAWTGTLGKQLLDLLDPVLEETDIPRPEKQWYEIAPGIKGFVARDPIGGAGIDIERFYNNMQKAIEAENGYKVLFKANQQEAIKLDIETHGIRMFASPARMIARNLGALRKQKAMVMKSNMNSKTKRQRIESINKQMTKAAKTFNGKLSAKQRARRKRVK